MCDNEKSRTPRSAWMGQAGDRCFYSGKGQVDNLFRQGIAAYKSGRNDEARRLLASFVKQDMDNEAGWEWLFLVCETDKERFDCLRQIIRINPQNEWALRWIRKYTAPEQPVKAPVEDKRPDPDLKNDALARKVARFLLLFQGSAFFIGIVFILAGHIPITLCITFISIVLLAGAFVWFYIRYRTEKARIKQLPPVSFPAFMRYGLASRGVAAAVIGAVLVLGPIGLGTSAIIGSAMAIIPATRTTAPILTAPTGLPIHTAAPSITQIPTLTAAPTITDTPTLTLSPTHTFTSTFTFTPTSSNAPTATIITTSIETRTPNPTDGSGCPEDCTYHKTGCDIKGNISRNTGEKIYHLPGQQNYAETVIDPVSGERWFCTEQEAVKNGWRMALR